MWQAEGNQTCGMHVFTQAGLRRPLTFLFGSARLISACFERAHGYYYFLCYGDLDRLTSYSNGQTNYNYSYDVSGNRCYVPHCCYHQRQPHPLHD